VSVGSGGSSASGESPAQYWTNEEHYVHNRDRRFVAVATDVATAEIIVAALNNLAAHREGGRDDAPDCALPAGTQNRWTSPVESDGRKASGECVPAGNLSLPNVRNLPADEKSHD
jgi:hypothetical protein